MDDPDKPSGNTGVRLRQWRIGTAWEELLDSMIVGMPSARK